MMQLICYHHRYYCRNFAALTNAALASGKEKCRDKQLQLPASTKQNFHSYSSLFKIPSAVLINEQQRLAWYDAQSQPPKPFPAPQGRKMRRKTELVQSLRNHVTQRMKQIIVQTGTDMDLLKHLSEKRKMQQTKPTGPDTGVRGGPMENCESIWNQSTSEEKETTIFDILDEFEKNNSIFQPFTSADNDEPPICKEDDNNSVADDADLIHRLLVLDDLLRQNPHTHTITENTDENGTFHANLQEKEDYTSIIYPVILEMLHGVTQNKFMLNTTEFNLILGALLLYANTTDTIADNDEDSIDVAENILTVYQVMKEYSSSLTKPDINTICILTSVLMNNGANAVAAKICAEMFGQHTIDNNYQQPAQLDDQMLAIAITCLTSAGKDYINEVEAIIEKASAAAALRNVDGIDTAIIPKSVLLTVINFYKDTNKPQKIRDLLQLCMNTQTYDSRTMNEIIKEAMHLGKQKGGGTEMSEHERIKHCEYILTLLHQDIPFFSPHISSWRKLITTLSHLSTENPSFCYPIISDACQKMIIQQQNYNGLRFFPGFAIIKIGLDAAEFTRNEQLGVDILKWGWSTRIAKPQEQSYDAEASMNISETEVGPYTTNYEIDTNNGMTISVLSRVLNLCINQGKMTLANETLRYCKESLSFTSPSGLFSLPIWTQLYTVVIAGHAQNGETREAQKLLQEMQNHGPTPSEKSYGSVIHSLAVEKRKEEAFELLNDMRCDKYSDSVKPESSCYAACMFAAMQVADWDAVLKLSEQMAVDGIPHSDVTIHGALLASARLQDKKSAMDLLQQAVEHKVRFNMGSLRHVMKLFFCDNNSPLSSFNYNTLSDVQKSLRLFAKERRTRNVNDVIASHAIALSTSIHIAEAEGNRKPSMFLKIEDIQEREDTIWNDILIQCYGLAKHLIIK